MLCIWYCWYHATLLITDVGTNQSLTYGTNSEAAWAAPTLVAAEEVVSWCCMKCCLSGIFHTNCLEFLKNVLTCKMALFKRYWLLGTKISAASTKDLAVAAHQSPNTYMYQIYLGQRCLWSQLSRYLNLSTATACGAPASNLGCENRYAFTRSHIRACTAASCGGWEVTDAM